MKSPLPHSHWRHYKSSGGEDYTYEVVDIAEIHRDINTSCFSLAIIGLFSIIISCSYQNVSSLGLDSYRAPLYHGLLFLLLTKLVVSNKSTRSIGCFLFSLFRIMNFLEYAEHARNKLRKLQAESLMDTHFRLSKTLREIILGITWIVSEKLSGEKLPR